MSGRKLLRNVGKFPPDYTALRPKRIAFFIVISVRASNLTQKAVGDRKPVPEREAKKLYFRGVTSSVRMLFASLNELGVIFLS
jgi:hypothetical protein